MTANSRPRHGTRGEERRAGIIRAALEVIAERGYRGTALGAVARRAGLTQQGLLHYFPNKEALLLAVLQERDAWDVGVSSGHSEPPDPERAWPLSNFRTLVDYHSMRPDIVRTFSALLGEAVTGDHPADSYFAQRYTWSRSAAASSLRKEYGERLPGSGLTPEQAAPLMIAVMDGLQFQWLLDPESVDMPESFRSFLALLGGAD